MASFATPSELNTYTGGTHDATRAQLLLDFASDAIRGYTGQTISEVLADTVTLDAPSDVLVLPQWPVTALTSVTVDGTALVLADDVHWFTDGRVYLQNGWWGREKRSVVVVYSHGYSTIPNDIKAVTLAKAARSLSAPVGATQESIGSYSVSFGKGADDFNEGEKAILDRYRTPVLA